MKFDLFESRIDESMLEWYRRRFGIPQEYLLHITNKKAYEPYVDAVKIVVYQDQLEGGLRFPLDPFLRYFLNR